MSCWMNLNDKQRQACWNWNSFRFENKKNAEFNIFEFILLLKIFSVMWSRYHFFLHNNSNRLYILKLSPISFTHPFQVTRLCIKAFYELCLFSGEYQRFADLATLRVLILNSEYYETSKQCGDGKYQRTPLLLKCWISSSFVKYPI